MLAHAGEAVDKNNGAGHLDFASCGGNGLGLGAWDAKGVGEVGERRCERERKDERGEAKLDEAREVARLEVAARCYSWIYGADGSSAGGVSKLKEKDKFET